MYTQCSFDNIKNKLDHYIGEDCMKKFADTLKDHVSIMINYEQKKKLNLLKKNMKIIKIKKFAIYATKNLMLMMKTKIITKLKIIVNLLVRTKFLAIRFADQNVDH